MAFGLTRLVACLCMFALLSPSRVARASVEQQAASFVRVQNGQFVLGEAPFRFVGANVSVMHGPKERRGYEEVLDAVAADGLKVVRLWALGEFMEPGELWYPQYAFRIGPSGWVEESFVHLDRVLVAAKQRGLKVIVVLANRWKDYGGIGNYLTWAGQEVRRDLRGEPAGTALAAFYGCAPCQTLYRQHVERVVGRINSVTQQAYRDDPTIMAWELINEASAVTARDEEALLAWVRDSARFVRSLDGNHLISAGHIGYRTLRERRVWEAVQALPEIDFADAHAYPRNDPRIASRSVLLRFMDDPLALAQQVLAKPLVFGEFGFERGVQPRGHLERLRWTEAFLRHANARRAGGALMWIYEPADNPRRSHTITADPSDAGSVRIRRALREASLAFGQPSASAAGWPKQRALPPFVHTESPRGTPRAHRGFAPGAQGFTLDIDPAAFATARFERAGVYEEGALTTVWGAGEGFVEYGFLAPPGVPRAFRVEARISSELPGSGDGQDPRDGSDVEVTIDGELVGIVRAMPDDGLGEVVQLELRDTRALKRAFTRARRHVLRFRALPSRYAGGLCIYGRPTGRAPLAPEAQRALETIRIQLEP